jgi:hypothetical protein
MTKTKKYNCIVCGAAFETETGAKTHRGQVHEFNVNSGKYE